MGGPYPEVLSSAVSLPANLTDRPADPYNGTHSLLRFLNARFFNERVQCFATVPELREVRRCR